SLVIPDPKDLVQKGYSREDETDVAKLRSAVLHVYHISQFAAIRSLVPGGVDLAEVQLIADKLEGLVSTSIMDSGLDASDDEELFKTLTRNYWLGSWAQSLEYRDDAWYPLVVRSLAGLLSRILKEFERRFLRSDVTQLVRTFEKGLAVH